jgi:hypothetical protein
MIIQFHSLHSVWHRLHRLLKNSRRTGFRKKQTLINALCAIGEPRLMVLHGRNRVRLGAFFVFQQPVQPVSVWWHRLHRVLKNKKRIQTDAIPAMQNHQPGFADRAQRVYERLLFPKSGASRVFQQPVQPVILESGVTR